MGVASAGPSGSEHDQVIMMGVILQWCRALLQG